MFSSNYRDFCSSSCGSTGSGVLVPLSLSFLLVGLLITSLFSRVAKLAALSLPPDLDDADCGLKVSGSSTSGKRAYSLIASHGIFPKNKGENKNNKMKIARIEQMRFFSNAMPCEEVSRYGSIRVEKWKRYKSSLKY